jgi:very-short-patch-repair endonuclease
MPDIHARKIFTERRKELRKNSTSQELLLWQQVRNRKVGVRFYRQHSIGPYITDFYCAEKRLVIEIDGNQHLGNKEYDKERTIYLENLNYTVLRFWNSDIDKNIIEVVERIKKVITRQSGQKPCWPQPS